MAKENKYAVEEGDVERWFIVHKKESAEVFSVSIYTYEASGFTTITAYDGNGNGVTKPEVKEISAVVSKYTEKKGKTIEIDNDLLRDKLRSALGREPRGKELENFRVYVEIDIPQWIVDNANSFVRR